MYSYGFIIIIVYVITDDDDPLEGPSVQDQLPENENKNTKTGTGEGKKANNQRKRKLSKQAGYENDLADFTSYQKEADTKFLKLIEQKVKVKKMLISESWSFKHTQIQWLCWPGLLLVRILAHTQQFVYDQETSQTLYRL